MVKINRPLFYNTLLFFISLWNYLDRCAIGSAPDSSGLRSRLELGLFTLVAIPFRCGDTFVTVSVVFRLLIETDKLASDIHKIIKFTFGRSNAEFYYKNCCNNIRNK